MAAFSERSLSMAGEPASENCTRVFAGKSEFRNTSRRSLMLSSPPHMGSDTNPKQRSDDLLPLFRNSAFSES